MSRACFASNSAYLVSEFGENMARRYFGDEVVDALPRFVRGKNAGKIKDHVIEWTKVTTGGWVSTSRATASGDADGYVENRVGAVITVELIHAPFRAERKTVRAWFWDRYASVKPATFAAKTSA